MPEKCDFLMKKNNPTKIQKNKIIGKKTCPNAARNIEGSAPDNGIESVSTTSSG